MHASAVLVREAGVLVRGESGSGKSALVLGLLDADPDATWLVADDRVVVTAHHGRALALVPAAIAGKLEIRGQGIVDRPFVSPVVVRLVVDLSPAGDCPRLPAREDERTTVDGIPLPRLALPMGSHDGVARVRAMLKTLGWRIGKPA